MPPLRVCLPRLQGRKRLPAPWIANCAITNASNSLEIARTRASILPVLDSSTFRTCSCRSTKHPLVLQDGPEGIQFGS
jgi:hypothetical protein